MDFSERRVVGGLVGLDLFENHYWFEHSNIALVVNSRYTLNGDGFNNLIQLVFMDEEDREFLEHGEDDSPGDPGDLIGDSVLLTTNDLRPLGYALLKLADQMEKGGYRTEPVIEGETPPSLKHLTKLIEADKK